MGQFFNRFWHTSVGRQFNSPAISSVFRRFYPCGKLIKSLSDFMSNFSKDCFVMKIKLYCQGRLLKSENKTKIEQSFEFWKNSMKYTEVFWNFTIFIVKFVSWHPSTLNPFFNWCQEIGKKTTMYIFLHNILFPVSFPIKKTIPRLTPSCSIFSNLQVQLWS